MFRISEVRVFDRHLDQNLGIARLGDVVTQSNHMTCDGMIVVHLRSWPDFSWFDVVIIYTF